IPEFPSHCLDIYSVDVLEQPAGQALPHAGDGAPAIEGRDLVWRGALDAREGQVRPQTVLIIKERQVAFPTLVDSTSGKALSAPGPGSRVGDRLAHRGPIVWAGGMRDMGQACGPLAPQGDATA